MKNLKLIALTVIVMLFCAAIFTAQNPPQQQTQGQRGQQGQRGPAPPPDPRDMGGGRCADNPVNCAETANPIPAYDSVWLEELTWIEVREQQMDRLHKFWWIQLTVLFHFPGYLALRFWVFYRRRRATA